MPLTSRRNLIQYGLSATAAIIAGCASLSNFESESSSEELIEPSGSIVSQPSDESPAEAILTLTNTGDASVEVKQLHHGVYPFELIGHLSGEGGDVLLYPPDAREEVTLYGGKLPGSRTNKCWRIIDTSDEDERDPYLGGSLGPKYVEIGPGGTYSVQHEAYYKGPESNCFPAGQYQNTTEIEIDNEDETQMDIIQTLDISSAKEFTISVTSKGKDA